MLTRFFSTLAVMFSLLAPAYALAASDTKPTLGEILRDIYAGTGEQVIAIVHNDELSTDAKVKAVSNVLKTKHDTAKNAIGNIR